MRFQTVFVAIVVAFALVIGAFLINRQRPKVETEQPSAALVRASGRCAECHYRQQYSVVHEYEMSEHARRGVNCLDCHQPTSNQKGKEHHGFIITTEITPGNCRACHYAIYDEFLRSRHAAAAWAAVYGAQSLSAEQVAYGEKYNPGYVNRPPNAIASLEGASAMTSGCSQCHSVGRPNSDGTIGNCTSCHTRHTSSVAIARLPHTCGQCHLGPDHSQMEIYTESRHGLLFDAQRRLLNLEADPLKLTTRDMFVPTCATCHMSGINGLKMTHDPGERLSYWLADAISHKRPDYIHAQANMKEVCNQCHTAPLIDRVYSQAEQVVEVTNQKVQAATDLINGLRKDGVLTGKPFTQPIDFVYFDYWHYDGRTAKHGAFMGGADFVQWHGNYPLVAKMVELQSMAAELRAAHAHAH